MSVGCDTLSGVDPQGLGLTYWFDAVPDGEPYPVTVGFVGQHTEASSVQSSLRRTLDVQSTVHHVVPGSGRISLTTRVSDLAPGKWRVTATPVSSPAPQRAVRHQYRPPRRRRHRFARLPAVRYPDRANVGCHYGHRWVDLCWCDRRQHLHPPAALPAAGDPASNGSRPHTDHGRDRTRDGGRSRHRSQRALAITVLIHPFGVPVPPVHSPPGSGARLPDLYVSMKDFRRGSLAELSFICTPQADATIGDGSPG